MIKVKILPKVDEIARSQYSVDNAAGEMHDVQRYSVAGMEEGCGCACESCNSGAHHEDADVYVIIYEAKDRCYRLAKSKYKTFPSAYASGAIVKCRQGKIWKKDKKK